VLDAPPLKVKGLFPRAGGPAIFHVRVFFSSRESFPVRAFSPPTEPAQHSLDRLSRAAREIVATRKA